MEGSVSYDESMATELRLGLPGTNSNSKKRPLTAPEPPPAKSQIVGWPPVRSYRKNSVMKKSREEMYVKVSMEGAPYLRKIDLKVYEGYGQLLDGLESMFKFKCMFNTPTYQDKDGDWMLLGDVPWDMFLSSCNKLRIVKQ